MQTRRMKVSMELLEVRRRCVLIPEVKDMCEWLAAEPGSVVRILARGEPRKEHHLYAKGRRDSHCGLSEISDPSMWVAHVIRDIESYAGERKQPR